MKKLILLFFPVLALVACEENSITKGEEIEQLEKLYQKIEQIAYSENCSDPSEWLITPIGSKACGGPTHYLPYSIQSDTTLFLELVEKYKLRQLEFNKKYRIYSDCAVPSNPSDVVCIDGKPEFVYE
ncbi:hypothetical protein OO013_02815 [Mangrovivirga sp. M17]|uniref:Lipoprotein n=1 Tax=Mangrovivirga halotolerans TaxID=2993936 RepID=A0ABT3RN30_9BACT|nr:hypothetical protein [Mangrovivirga halotolerans]MCX2742779.1 hypothetical protein [Mangrovivirga halotolerans]